MGRPAASSGLAASPEVGTPGPGGSVPERATTPGFTAASSDDPGTDLEDKLVYVSPLPPMISPFPDSDDALPVSPSRYLEPPVPARADSPVPVRVGNALPTRDLFPPYAMSPECSSYDPAVSPIATDIPDSSEFPSLGSPAGSWRRMGVCC